MNLRRLLQTGLRHIVGWVYCKKSNQPTQQHYILNESYLKLLLNVFDHRLAIQTNERAVNQLRMNGMRPNHLSGYAQQSSDLLRLQLSNFVKGRHVNETDVALFIALHVAPVLDEVGNSLVTMMIDSMKH